MGIFHSWQLYRLHIRKAVVSSGTPYCAGIVQCFKPSRTNTTSRQHWPETNSHYSPGGNLPQSQNRCLSWAERSDFALQWKTTPWTPVLCATESSVPLLILFLIPGHFSAFFLFVHMLQVLTTLSFKSLLLKMNVDKPHCRSLIQKLSSKRAISLFGCLHSEDNSQPRTRSWRQVCQIPYHHRSSHQQRAAMARFPKLPPVVFVAIQLPIFLIVPVREGILAFRTPWRKQRSTVPVSSESQSNGKHPLLHGENRRSAAAHHWLF